MPIISPLENKPKMSYSRKAVGPDGPRAKGRPAGSPVLFFLRKPCQQLSLDYGVETVRSAPLRAPLGRIATV